MLTLILNSGTGSPAAPADASERNYILGSGTWGGAGVYQFAGGIAQYNTSASSAIVFRRTINRRVGSRGAVT